MSVKSAILNLLLILPSVQGDNYLRRKQEDEGGTPPQKQARLVALDQQEQEHSSRTTTIRDLSSEIVFAPLSCNTELDVSKCNIDTTLSSILNDADTSKEVQIPCGTCALVDTTDGSTVSIPSGLNIEGMLYFPSSSNVVIETTHIFVQGKLKMDPPGVSSASSNSIRIRVVGTDEQYLHPHEENAASCDEQIGCKVGQKAFVVAGGQLDINGIHDSDCPSFTHLKAKPSATQIQIEENTQDSSTSTATMATDCWGVGDEILITNTKGAVRGFNDQLVRTIAAVDKNTGTLTFSEAINPPLVTTEMDPNTASEVASLSRKIVFEGEGDPSALHGGHLMIFHTPNVIQHLEGVEFRNFGQQGTIGRYPIHFHMSNRVAGSIVRKNVIRQSNQRCVVIHGSHGVIIEDNVAFDTFGHCYITEDGAEIDNYFIGNLGARTKGIPDAATFLGTSDKFASTYWITNPMNHYIGNVAAGSPGSGFWFELRGVRGDSKPLYPNANPKKSPLYTFRNNISHSNGDMGIRTYAPGFQPPTPAFFESIKCYQNRNNLFIHGTSNLKVVNSFFANGNGILYFGNGGGNFIENSTFDLRCGQSGITYSLEPKPNQITIRNNSFLGYAEGCEDKPGVALLQGNAQAKSKYTMASLENLTFDSNAVDAVVIKEKFENRIILYEDPDGSMNPSGEPGFFVNDVVSNKIFLDDPEACSAGISGKGLFCPNICMRRVEIDTGCCSKKFERPTNDYKMVVTSITDPSKSFTFEKYVMQGGLWYSGKKFIFGLPSGNYRLDFIDENDGSIKVPSSISFEFGPEPTCTDYVTEDSFTLGMSNNNVDSSFFLLQSTP